MFPGGLDFTPEKKIIGNRKCYGILMLGKLSTFNLYFVYLKRINEQIVKLWLAIITYMILNLLNLEWQSIPLARLQLRLLISAKRL